jgi:hypothetical protein
MNIVQTALVFVGTPLGIALVIASAVYGPTIMRPNRYRPGRPWTYEPVWYVGNPRHVPARPTLAPGATRAQALTASTMADVEQNTSVGGANGEW